MSTMLDGTDHTLVGRSVNDDGDINGPEITNDTTPNQLGPRSGNPQGVVNKCSVVY